MKQNKHQPWPEDFGERFHLFALGESFDVDAFLASSTLTPSYVWRGLGNGPTNGFDLLLGDAATLKLSEQEEIAINYLRDHRDELRALAQSPGLEVLNLGLQYFPSGSATGLVVGPSRRLMYHCLDVGARPNYYISFHRLTVQRRRKVSKGTSRG